MAQPSIVGGSITAVAGGDPQTLSFAFAANGASVETGEFELRLSNIQDVVLQNATCPSPDFDCSIDFGIPSVFVTVAGGGTPVANTPNAVVLELNIIPETPEQTIEVQIGKEQYWDTSFVPINPGVNQNGIVTTQIPPGFGIGITTTTPGNSITLPLSLTGDNLIAAGMTFNYDPATLTFGAIDCPSPLPSGHAVSCSHDAVDQRLTVDIPALSGNPLITEGHLGEVSFNVGSGVLAPQFTPLTIGSLVYTQAGSAETQCSGFSETCRQADGGVHIRQPGAQIEMQPLSTFNLSVDFEPALFGTATQQQFIRISNVGAGQNLTGVCQPANPFFTPSAIFTTPSSINLDVPPDQSVDVPISCDSLLTNRSGHGADFQCTGTNSLSGDPVPISVSCDLPFGDTIVLGNVSAPAGSTAIDVPVYFAAQVMGNNIRANVLYDSANLTATGCTALNGNTLSQCDVVNPGVVAVVVSSTAPVNPEILFNITFDASGAAPGDYALKFDRSSPENLGIYGPQYFETFASMPFELEEANGTLTLVNSAAISFNATAVDFGVQSRGGAAPASQQLVITNPGVGQNLTGSCQLNNLSPASGNALTVSPPALNLNLAPSGQTTVTFDCDDTAAVATHTADYVCSGTNAAAGDPAAVPVSCELQAADAEVQVTPSSLNLTPTPASVGSPPPTNTLTITNAADPGARDITSLSCALLSGSTITAGTAPPSSLAPGAAAQVEFQCDTAAAGSFSDTYRCNYELDASAGLDGPLDIPVSCTVQVNQPPALVTPLADYSTSVGENLLIDVTSFFSDPEGQALTFSLSSGSSFAMDDPNIPGLIVGTTTATDRQNSPLNLTLVATDPAGNDAPGQTITILVEDEVSPQFEFERYFPALQQPWYFSQITDLEAAGDGTVYVADAIRGKVTRFSKDGLLVTQWGELGAGDAEFTFLQLKLALADDGRVMTASGSRLQIFSRNGVLEQVTDYLEPLLDVAVDNQDHLYLLFADRIDIRPADQLNLLTDTIDLNRPPGSIAVNAAGRIFLSQRSSGSAGDFDEIVRFDPEDGGFATLSAFPTTDADDLSFDSRNLLYAVGDADSVIRAYNAAGIEQISNNVTSVTDSGLRAITFGDQNRSYISSGSQVFGVDGDTAMRSFSWQSTSGEPGRFDQPLAVTVDGANQVYVASAEQSRVQKFTRSGVLLPLSSWDLQEPISNPETARVYLHATSDSPTRVLVSTGSDLETYTGSGELVTPDPFAGLNLVSPGPLDGTPEGRLVLTDTNGAGTTFYVVTRNGVVVEGPWQAPQCRISDLTVGPNSLIYLLCEPGAVGPEIQVFSQRGEPISSRTVALSSGNPRSLASDSLGRIFLLNTENQITPGVGITSFDSSINVYRGDLTELDTLGTSGYAAGRFNFDGEVAGLSVGSSGELVIAEPGNNRVQILKPQSVSSNNKAIIVAGGGDYPENFLWEATQMNTNNAYDKLVYQGFTADRILYLHPDQNLDLDGNPSTQEIDGAPTLENLARAFGALAGPVGDGITDFAVDADNLVVYFADHGDKEVFRVNPQEVVDSDQVGQWLSTLQNNRWPSRQQGAPLGNDGWLTVIYEACESGTFLNELGPINGLRSNKRVVITTSSSDQNASFIAQGLLSFSYQFWINVFNGNDVLESYSLAAATIADAYPQQAPLLRVVFEGAEVAAAGVADFFTNNASASSRVIGNGTANAFSGPQIVGPRVTLDGASSGTIEVEMVDDADGISRVWAIVEPPAFLVRDAKNPILELPTVDLDMDCANGIDYCGTFDGFTSAGEYRLEILAQDIFGNVTRFPNRQQASPDPLLTLDVGNPLKNKAVLLVAGDNSQRGRAQIENGDFAYQALLRQDFANDLDPATPNVSAGNDEVRYFTQSTRTGADVGTPSIGQLLTLVTGGFVAADTQHFVLIITADSGAPDVNGLVFAGNGPPLLTADLKDFLDDVENVISGRILVVLEGDGSGALLPQLVDNSSRRIVIASASGGEKSNLVGAGGVSFSKFFWNAVRDGFSVGSAYQLAATATAQSGSRQQPLLDDNGNAIANDREDGLLARTFFIGPGIARAGNGPLISGAMPDLVIDSEAQQSAMIVADNVTSTSDTAVAVVGNVSVPGTQLELGDFELTSASSQKGTSVNLGAFEGSFDGFVAGGDYDVTVFAVDELGSPSNPQIIRVRKTAGADYFELDNAPNAATPLIGDAAAQRHTLHEQDDEDWLVFFLSSAEVRILDLSFRDLDPGLRLRLQLFDSARLTNPQAAEVLEAVVDPGPATDVSIPPSLPGGMYLARITRQSFSAVSGSDPSPGYSVGLSSPFGDLGGLLSGTVVDQQTGNPIGLAAATALANQADSCGTPPCEAGTVPTCDRAVCGNQGGFRLFLNQGSYSVRVRAPGYEDLELSGFQIEPGGSTQITPNPIQMVPLGGATPPALIMGSVQADARGLLLSGTINANGAQASGRFLVGADEDSLAPIAPGLLITGSTAQTVTASAIGLDCGSSYVVALNAENAGGASSTPAVTVNTLPCVSGGDVVFGNGFEN